MIFNLLRTNKASMIEVASDLNKVQTEYQAIRRKGTKLIFERKKLYDRIHRKSLFPAGGGSKSRLKLQKQIRELEREINRHRKFEWEVNQKLNQATLNYELVVGQTRSRAVLLKLKEQIKNIFDSVYDFQRGTKIELNSQILA